MIDWSVNPVRLEVFQLEAPISTHRRNAFGTMRSRPALLVRMTDASGVTGWGEAFCNWPSFAAAHRRRILTEILAPLATAQKFPEPASLWRSLTDAVRPIVLQSNEPGPFEQCIAALDIAAWDIVARRVGKSLLEILGGNAKAVVSLYASALTNETLEALVPPLVDAGWTGFKVKVGFGRTRDRQAVETLCQLAPGVHCMADANQKWNVEQATEFVGSAFARHLDWIEEPLPADAPWSDWQALSRASQIPIAAGENIRGEACFAAGIRDGEIGVLQPDPTKWGGISGLRRISAIVRESGAIFAPHFLGSGLGLMATAHAVAALGAQWLECDVTENPLRESLLPPGFMATGRVSLDGTDIVGIGIEPDETWLSEFATT